MKQKFSTSSWSRKVTGSMATIAAAALAISLAACDDSSSAASSDDQDGLSSETPTSSETNGNSAPSQDGNSSTSQEGGSSAATGTSSNSSAGNSSNSEKTCAHITDNECRITQGCAMTPCMDGTKTLDCATNSEYVCKSGSWQLAETCANISSVTGNDRWNCDEDDFTLTKDCADNSITYMCVSNHWFKTEDCDPTKPNCGFDNYKLCRITRLKKFCVDSAWVKEPCDPEVHGFERTLYTYDEPDNPEETSFTQMRYFCENGEWISEKNSYNCPPMMDCGNGNNKSDDHGILPDGAPCNNAGEQMTVEGYNFQCINNVWTRL